MKRDFGSTEQTTKTLFVLRHAKSSWDDPGLGDHDRPLAPRGQKAAKVVAEHIRANELEPDVVLCSSARRTRETLELMNPAGEWVIDPKLYGADADDVLDRIRRVPEQTRSVMVIGHNPAMQELVLDLADAGNSASIDEARRKFPTGALATLTFGCAWSELSPGSARLASLVWPKQLSQT
jgi:phosphohistidine phosphatase